MERYLPLSEITITGEQLPAVVPICNYGQTEYTKNGVKGSFNFSEADADNTIAEFERRKLDLPLDYEHSSLTGQEAPAAGWIEKLEKTKDGLIAKVKLWTDKAANYLKSREYRYYSPVLKFDEAGKVHYLHSVALTNKPALNNIKALIAKDNSINNNPTGAKDMDKELMVLLGLEAFSEKSAEEKTKAVNEKVKALSDKASKTDAFLKLHGAETLEAFTEKVKGLIPAAEKAALETELKKRDAAQAVTLAMSEGKITEAMKNWAVNQAEKDLASFTDWAKVAPKVVPPGTGTDQQKVDPKGSQQLVLSETDLKVCKAMGIKPEDYKKELNGNK